MCRDVVVVSFDMVKLMWKKQWGRERDRAPHFVIFVVWSALVVGGWVVAAWGKKSYLGPAEISTTVYLV